MTADLRVRISAHARHPPGAESFTMEACRAAVAAGADYVEVDIRRTADDELVAFHDAQVQGRPVSALDHAELRDLAGYPVPKVADALETMAGRARGHLDLKGTGYEDRVVRLALDTLGPGQFVVTTSEDVSVAAIKSRFPDAGEVAVALSLGIGMHGAPPAELLRARFSELRPFPRLRACGADWVALNHRLAMAGLARQCRRRGLKVMVWTVNSEPGIRYWLSRQRTDVLITDHPAQAIAIRDQSLAPGEGGLSRPPRGPGRPEYPVVADWAGPVAARSEAAGASPETARAAARLAVAVTRGLLLDVLATGEVAEADAAMRLFADIMAAHLPTGQPNAAFPN